MASMSSASSMMVVESMAALNGRSASDAFEPNDTLLLLGVDGVIGYSRMGSLMGFVFGMDNRSDGVPMAMRRGDFCTVVSSILNDGGIL